MCQASHRDLSLPKSVWIVATGSRGDIQPHVAVGAAMVKRGYKVTFLTFDSYAAFAETLGMKGVSLGQDYETSITANDKVHKGMKQGDVLVVLSGMAQVNRENAPTYCESFLAELNQSGPPDLCIATPMNQYLAWYLYARHNVPFQIVNTFAFAYNSDRFLRGIPKFPSGVSSYILHHTLINGSYEGFKSYDEYLNANILETFTKQKHLDFYKNPTLPMVTLASPEIASILYPKHISDKWKFVGSAVISSQQQVRKLEYFGGKTAFIQLKDFLQAGPKPVYLGWANMVCKSPEDMVELCCRAVAHSGQRAIVKGGAAGLSLEMLMDVKDIDPNIVEYAKENILFVEYAPHEWLFSQVSATVHHGGPGTITAALRCGVPTVVTPVFGNHFDASRLVSLLSVGIGFNRQLQMIEWKELGDAIRMAATDIDMARRAAALGTKLRQEDGANEAVDEMEHYWNEYCVTGKLFETFPLPKESKEEQKASQPEDSNQEGDDESTMTNETSNETDSDEGDSSAIDEHPFQLDESEADAAVVYDETKLDKNLNSVDGLSEVTGNPKEDKEATLLLAELMLDESEDTVYEAESIGDSSHTRSDYAIDEDGELNLSDSTEDDVTSVAANEFQSDERPESRLMLIDEQEIEETYPGDVHPEEGKSLSIIEPEEDDDDLVLVNKARLMDEYHSENNLNESNASEDKNNETRAVPIGSNADLGEVVKPVDDEVDEDINGLEIKDDEPSRYNDIEKVVYAVLVKAEEDVQAIKAQAAEKISILKTQTDDKLQAFKVQANDKLHVFRMQLKLNLHMIRTQTEEMLQSIQTQAREKLQVIAAQMEELSQVIRAQAQEKLQAIITQAEATLQRIATQTVDLLNDSTRKLKDGQSTVAVTRPLSRKTKTASVIACASFVLLVSSRRR
jgi:sterol 3beta-glucosyltransferase